MAEGISIEGLDGHLIRPEKAPAATYDNIGSGENPKKSGNEARLSQYIEDKRIAASADEVKKGSEAKSPENIQRNVERSEMSETTSLQEATKLLFHINSSKAVSIINQPDMWRLADEEGGTFVRDQSKNEHWEVKINRRFENGPNYEAVIKKMVSTVDNGTIITESAVNSDSQKITARRYRLDEEGKEVPVPHSFDNITPKEVFTDLSNEIKDLPYTGFPQFEENEYSSGRAAEQPKHPEGVVNLADVRKESGLTASVDEENMRIEDESPENLAELTPEEVSIEAEKLKKQLGIMWKKSKIQKYGVLTDASEIPGLPIGKVNFNKQLLYHNSEEADQPAWAIDFNVVKGSRGIVIQPKSGEHIYIVINDNPEAPRMELIQYDPENLEKFPNLRPELYNNKAAAKKIKSEIAKMPQLSEEEQIAGSDTDVESEPQGKYELIQDITPENETDVRKKLNELKSLREETGNWQIGAGRDSKNNIISTFFRPTEDGKTWLLSYGTDDVGNISLDKDVNLVQVDSAVKDNANIFTQVEIINNKIIVNRVRTDSNNENRTQLPFEDADETPITILDRLLEEFPRPKN